MVGGRVTGNRFGRALERSGPVGGERPKRDILEASALVRVSVIVGGGIPAVGSPSRFGRRRNHDMQSRRRALPGARWKCAPLAPPSRLAATRTERLRGSIPHATQPNFIPTARSFDRAGKEYFFRPTGIAAPVGKPGQFLEGDPLSIPLDDGPSVAARSLPSFRGRSPRAFGRSSQRGRGRH